MTSPFKIFLFKKSHEKILENLYFLFSEGENVNPANWSFRVNIYINRSGLLTRTKTFKTPRNILAGCQNFSYDCSQW